MKSRRIILANEPRLLRDMLKRVLDRVHGIQVVGEYTDWARLLETAARSDAQWVIVSLCADGKLPDVAELLLTANPRLRILAVANDGSQTKTISRERVEAAETEISLEKLVKVLTVEDSIGNSRR